MGADQTQDRTPHKDAGRGGVWLEEHRFAEAGSFEWYLWLAKSGACHWLMDFLIGRVQVVGHEERARLALDFPEVVAALEAPDWCKATVGRAEEREGERVLVIGPGDLSITEVRPVGEGCFVQLDSSVVAFLFGEGTERVAIRRVEPEPEQGD